MQSASPSPAQANTPAPGAPAWHAMPATDCLGQLSVDPAKGLSQAQARARLQAAGPNRLPDARRRHPLQRFLLQFHNVLIYVLMGAALITAMLGHWIDSAVIGAVIVINALIGFIQEGKAEQALQAIHQLLPFNARVLRDGQRHEIDAANLVPGDIVLLASGDKVPADVRLLDSRSLRIEEAALTGESLAVEKTPAPVALQAALGDRHSMAYSGTLVTYGQGSAVVVATGAATEIGRINAMLANVEELTTPLLRQLSGFGRMLTLATLALATLVFAFGVGVRSYPLSEMFMVAVGLAVALIPEGLPAIMTITLAIGVRRMALRNAIIRRLPAVEALGSVTVICTDKTGTLTRNEMTVRRIIVAGASYDVEGVGYTPHGTIADAAGNAPDPDLLAEIGRVALLCNDAALEQCGEQWQVAGDPTEGALISLAHKIGRQRGADPEILPRIDAIPFESEHRFMATLHQGDPQANLILLKGAPERVMALCSWQRGPGTTLLPFSPASLEADISAAADDGMRLLALAERRGAPTLRALDFPDIEQGGFTLLAIVGLADPPRAEAVAAVAHCLSAGIRVKMITGDHGATARAIASQVGLAAPHTVLSGPQIDQLDDAGLADAAQASDVFARASPEHKLRLVRALQGRGEVVAMTGDGVNDAPALKRADVGVAMGGKGTEVAKESAEMVLADDNFASIAAAVEEGRAVYDNIRKSIMFILPTNGGQAGILLIAIVLGLTMPISPVQILWVNMITAVTLALALAFEAPEQNIMQRPPRNAREPLLNRFLGWRIGFVTLMMIAGGMGLFLWEVQRGASLETARTAAVNALVMGEVAYLFSVRRFAEPAWHGLFRNRAVLIAIGVLLVLQGAFTYAPVMQTLFGSAPLDAPAWLRIVSFGAILFLLVEIEKWLLLRRGCAFKAMLHD